jgi:hypothetical protein
LGGTKEAVVTALDATVARIGAILVTINRIRGYRAGAATG